MWLPNQGRFMEYGDYYPQYVPFLLEMKRMVFSGSLGWSWNSFLGDSFVSAYSYYTVFNPFAWFVILFPESMILYATLLTALLKLALGTSGILVACILLFGYQLINLFTTTPDVSPWVSAACAGWRWATLRSPCPRCCRA